MSGATALSWRQYSTDSVLPIATGGNCFYIATDISMTTGDVVFFTDDSKVNKSTNAEDYQKFAGIVVGNADRLIPNEHVVLPTGPVLVAVLPSIVNVVTDTVVTAGDILSPSTTTAGHVGVEFNGVSIGVALTSGDIGESVLVSLVSPITSAAALQPGMLPLASWPEYADLRKGWQIDGATGLKIWVDAKPGRIIPTERILNVSNLVIASTDTDDPSGGWANVENAYARIDFSGGRSASSTTMGVAKGAFVSHANTDPLPVGWTEEFHILMGNSTPLRLGQRYDYGAGSLYWTRVTMAADTGYFDIWEGGGSRKNWDVGDTLFLYDSVTDALQPVTIGANDSAGAGFRMLMVPNSP